MRILLAIATGVLLAVSFPRFYFGWAATFALIPLLFALEQPGNRSSLVSLKVAFRLGYLAGLVFFLLLLYWITFLPQENLTIPYAMFPALLLMALYLSLYPALTALTSVWLARRGAPLGLVFACLWTLFEAVRGSGMFGFPWGSLGYALAPYPHLIQFASYSGIWGVSLWLALISGMVHFYLSLPWSSKKVGILVAMMVVLTIPYAHSRVVLSARQPQAAVRVGLVQPNIGNNKWQKAVRDSVVTVLLEQTKQLADENINHPPDLILWPETAIPARLPREAFYRFRVEDVVTQTNVPLLAGFPDGEPLSEGGYRFTNSAGLFLPNQGMVNRYDKRHLVPFSEFFPLPVLNRLDFGQSNFSSGDKPGVIDNLSQPFGVLICFESIFPGPARELSREGVRYLVNLTNDQWFGDSAAPTQHFYMNVLRAIENRMGLARAANTGISGVIDPYGIVRERSTTFIQARMLVPVELGRELTFYARYGDWILWVTGGLVFVFWGLGRRYL